MWRLAILLSLSGTLAPAVAAQLCPTPPMQKEGVESETQTFHGKVVLHEDLRTWLELLPDREVCGERSIQLLQGSGGAFAVDEEGMRGLEVLRGCSVTFTGKLGVPGTAYYSAPLYLNVQGKRADVGCVSKAALPDYSKLRPNRGLKTYRVAMFIDYGEAGKIHASIRADGKRLEPWQKYASYFLTGGYVLYADCAKGYSISRLRGTPAAKPWLLDNEIAADPENAAEKGIRTVWLSYTCTR